MKSNVYFWLVVFIVGILSQSCKAITVKELSSPLQIAQNLVETQHEDAHTYVYSYLQKNPADIDMHIFFQDALLQKEKEIYSYEELLQKIKNKHVLAYLTIRMSIDETSKQEKLEEIVALYPLPQIHFDLAQIYYDSKNAAKAFSHIESAIALDDSWAKAYELRAFILLLKLNWRDALASARQALALDASKIKPHFFEAANYLLSGQYLSTIKTIKKVQVLHPHYKFNEDEQIGLLTTYWRELLQMQEAGLSLSGLYMAEEALADFSDQSVLLSLKGKFAFDLGMYDVAETSIRESLQKNPFSLRAVQIYRKILLRNKKYQEAYDVWAKIVPESLIFHAQNKLRDRYERFRKAIKNAQENNIPSLYELAQALTNIGWEEEALIVYEQFTEKSQQEQDVLKKHLAFLRGVRKYVITYYQTKRKDIVSMLNDLSKMAALYDIHLQTFPNKEFESYLAVVKEIDPFDLQAGTLGNYLRQYNKFFDMGNNYGQIEFRLTNLLSDREHKRIVWGKDRVYRCIVIDETYIDSFSGHYSGASTIAGRAFLSNKGFYVAADTLRPNISTLQSIYDRAMAPEPIPEKFDLENKEHLPYIKSIADAFLHAALHQELIDLPENDEDKWQKLFHIILEKNIKNVHNHEFGHINDLPCFMPISSHLGKHIDLLWKHNFSPENIQMRFEHVAELFGIAHTDYLYYYLFQEMERLNADFDGIFTMVYWAWYGRLPNEDPYYRSASKIFWDLTRLHGEKNWETLKSLPFIDKNVLQKMIYHLCHEEGIDIRCDCGENQEDGT